MRFNRMIMDTTGFIISHRDVLKCILGDDARRTSESVDIILGINHIGKKVSRRNRNPKMRPVAGTIVPFHQGLLAS